jgi:hypothetical protein
MPIVRTLVIKTLNVDSSLRYSVQWDATATLETMVKSHWTEYLRLESTLSVLITRVLTIALQISSKIGLVFGNPKTEC